MNIDDPVPLIRQFSPVLRSEKDTDTQDFRALLGYSNHVTWAEIDKRYRSVILAEAGAGKTFEMRARAKHLEGESRYAFFIRIEDIDNFLSKRSRLGVPNRSSSGSAPKPTLGSTSIQSMKPGLIVRGPLRRQYVAFRRRSNRRNSAPMSASPADPTPGAPNPTAT